MPRTIYRKTIGLRVRPQKYIKPARNTSVIKMQKPTRTVAIGSAVITSIMIRTAIIVSSSGTTKSW